MKQAASSFPIFAWVGCLVLVLLAALVGWALIRPVPAAVSDTNPPALEAGETLKLRHAKGFRASRLKDGIWDVSVVAPWRQAATSYNYRLIPRDRKTRSEQVVPVPCQRVVALSTSHLPMLDMLGALNGLIGVANIQDVTNPSVWERFRAGQIVQIGSGEQLNLERLLELDPDVIFMFCLGPDDKARLRPVEAAGIPVVVVGEYAEETPLGRAEWLRFFGLFLGRQDLADARFAEIEDSYRGLVARAQRTIHRPSVLVGNSYKGTWYVPGGKSLMATLIRDAGGKYLWEDDTSTGVRSLDIEAVLARGSEADFWINTGTWRWLDDALADDPRYGHFAAFRNGKVFNNDRITGPGGGSDFWETGLVRPDLVLADLAKLFHPELARNHPWTWYRQLQCRPKKQTDTK